MNLASVGYAQGLEAPPFMQLERVFLQNELKAGFNIAVMSRWSGSIESIKNFNTQSDKSEDIEKMTSFLNTLPVDRIVTGVVKDEAFKGVENNPKLQAALVCVCLLFLFINSFILILSSFFCQKNDFRDLIFHRAVSWMHQFSKQQLGRVLHLLEQLILERRKNLLMLTKLYQSLVAALQNCLKQLNSIAGKKASECFW